MVLLSSSVLNFSDLYNMSCVLSEAGLASDAAFTIKEHFSTAPGLKSLSEVCTYYKRSSENYTSSLFSVILCSGTCGH